MILSSSSLFIAQEVSARGLPPLSDGVDAGAAFGEQASERGGLLASEGTQGLLSLSLLLFLHRALLRSTLLVLHLCRA